jgi:hypothetical protein
VDDLCGCEEVGNPHSDDLRGCEEVGDPHSYEIFGTLPTHCSFYVQQAAPAPTILHDALMNERYHLILINQPGVSYLIDCRVHNKQKQYMTIQADEESLWLWICGRHCGVSSEDGGKRRRMTS